MVGGPARPGGYGVTTGISPARALLIAVRECLDERYPHWTFRVGALPEGLRLELHPSARTRLWQDDYTRDWPRDWSPVFRVPVKVTPDLPDGTWRLVVVTEDVLAGGEL